MPWERQLGIAKPKVTVTVRLDARTLRRIDRLLRDGSYSNRSEAIEAVVTSQLERLERRRLIDACAQLDPAEERALAEEGLAEDAAAWPAYLGERFGGLN